jgi:ABC-type multidrug transport system fused ATPase/permease subunit
MVQFDAEFHFLQNGTTTTLYNGLTPLTWPYFVFHFGYGANYFWSHISNIALTSRGLVVLIVLVVLVVLVGSMVLVVLVLVGLLVPPVLLLLIALVVLVLLVLLVLLHTKMIRYGRSCASKRAVKVIRSERKPCKTRASERLKTINLCKLQGTRAVARVRHALSYGAMPSRLDM